MATKLQVLVVMAIVVNTLAADCGLPAIPQFALLNGTVDWDTNRTFVAGTAMFYSCRDSNRRLLDGNEVITCHSSGQWNGSTPSCDENVLLNELLNLTIFDSQYHVRTARDVRIWTDGIIQADSSCMDITDGYEHRISLETKDAPLLSSIHIHILGTLSENNKLNISVPNGSIYRLDNYDNHSVIVVSNVTLKSGDFVALNPSETFAICEIEAFRRIEEFNCDAPENPAHGHIKTNEHHTVTYTCSEGYDLVGPDTRTCTGTQWTEDAPKCEAIENVKLETTLHTEVPETATVQNSRNFSEVVAPPNTTPTDDKIKDKKSETSFSSGMLTGFFIGMACLIVVIVIGFIIYKKRWHRCTGYDRPPEMQNESQRQKTCCIV